MENLNRVLLENVLPAHVAEHFLARNWKNEVGHVNNVLFIYLLRLKKTTCTYQHGFQIQKKIYKFDGDCDQIILPCCFSTPFLMHD